MRRYRCPRWSIRRQPGIQHRTSRAAGAESIGRSFGRKGLILWPGMSPKGGYCSLMGQGRKLFGCRRFRVPAFSACSFGLDGVSWVQRGSVEIAVGHRLTACCKIHAVVCSLPRASLLLGAGFGLCGGLGQYELRLVSQHRMHDDPEAASQSNPRLAHR